MAHPIEGLMDSALKNIKSMVDVNTIIGEPIQAGDGVVLIPISRVAFGFGAGGSNFGDGKTDVEKQSFGGGAGGGVSISPVAFLVVSNGSVRMLPVDQTSTVDKIIDLAPDLVEKVLKKFEKKESKTVISEEEIIIE
ncbi:MAG: GerW family sporulation protein [Clostridia bacterium]|nr:GerW family sporulation protein [Clostridia bacterium]